MAELIRAGAGQPDPLAEIQEGLVIGPDDLLLIRVRPDISREEFDRLRAAARETFGERVSFIAADQIAVLRAVERP